MTCDFWIQLSIRRNIAGNQKPQVTGQGYILIYSTGTVYSARILLYIGPLSVPQAQLAFFLGIYWTVICPTRILSSITVRSRFKKNASWVAFYLLKPILDRYRPDRSPVSPTTVRFRFKKNTSLVAFYLNLYWTVIDPTGVQSVRQRSDLDLRRMQAG